MNTVMAGGGPPSTPFPEPPPLAVDGGPAPAMTMSGRCASPNGSFVSHQTLTAAGILTLGPGAFRAALGYGGIRADKQEGDGGTPTGLLPLRMVLYRPDRQPAPVCAVPVRALASDDGWCDESGHASYNRPVRLPAEARAEALWRDDAVYDIIGVLGWNDDPVLPGLGSAIFLHVARPDYAPTEGCIALAADDLIAVLARGLTEILVV